MDRAEGVGATLREQVELERFFPQVVADGEGGEGGGREFHPHALHDLEEVGGGEVADGEVGGEEGEVALRERDRVDRRDGGLAEVAEDPFAGPVKLRIVGALDLEIVGPRPPLPRVSLRTNPAHKPVIGGLLEKAASSAEVEL